VKRLKRTSPPQVESLKQPLPREFFDLINKLCCRGRAAEARSLLARPEARLHLVRPRDHAGVLVAASRSGDRAWADECRAALAAAATARPAAHRRAPRRAASRCAQAAACVEGSRPRPSSGSSAGCCWKSPRWKCPRCSNERRPSSARTAGRVRPSRSCRCPRTGERSRSSRAAPTTTGSLGATLQTPSPTASASAPSNHLPCAARWSEEEVVLYALALHRGLPPLVEPPIV